MKVANRVGKFISQFLYLLSHAITTDVSLLGGNICNSQGTCKSCYESSFICHWCKDIPPAYADIQNGSCHYKLSQFGCQVGDACSSDDCFERKTCSSCSLGGCKWCASANSCVSPYSWKCALPSNCLPNEECKRKTPEFVGFLNAIPVWLEVSMVIGYLILVVLSCVVSYFIYLTLVQMPRGNEETTPLTTPSSYSGTRMTIFKLGVILWGLVVLGFGCILLVVSFYWPTPPEVSLCNAELMWKDTMNMIIQTVTSGKATVESEILITVYNPNRLGLALNSLNGSIYYKAVPIGTLQLDQVEAVPGSATDALGVIAINGFDDIADMLYDFNVNHKLLLQFELFINFTTGGYTLGISLPKFEVNVNDPPPQKHCNCTNSTHAGTPSSFETFLDYEVM